MPSSRPAAFLESRITRAKVQWSAFGPMLAQMLTEEARSLGTDLDSLIAPVRLEAHKRLTHAMASLTKAVPKVLDAAHDAIKRLP
jgi:hypothetical protein